MTENTTTVVPQNVPFNLIVAQSRAQVHNIATHFDLSDVRFVDDLKLPEGGPKRGDALNELLAAQDHTVTLAVLVEAPWIDTLVDNSSMAAGVWRSVETKLLGHRTSQQRNLIIAAKLFVGSVRKAEDEGRLVSIIAGQPLPNHWKPARPVAEKPAKKLEFVKKPEQMQKDQARRKKSTSVDPAATVDFLMTEHAKQKKVRVVLEGKVGLNANGVKNFPQKVKGATPSGKVGNPGGFQMAKPEGKGKPDRSQKNKQRQAYGNEALYNDLYLLCKGHYGTAGGELLVCKAAVILEHHTGVKKFAGDCVQQLASALFQTLITKSGRGYWGGFNLLQQLAVAGGKGPYAVVETLSTWINNIPVRDAAGHEIAQPAVTTALYVKLNVQAETIEAPAGPRVLPTDAVTTA